MLFLVRLTLMMMLFWNLIQKMNSDDTDAHTVMSDSCEIVRNT